MPRLQPRSDVLRALFARSGNRCTFPGCTAALVNEKNQFIAQVCHIEAAEAGGERFNVTRTDEQRRAYENLILFCYPHHIETNDESLYTAERLSSMKSSHEKIFGQKMFQIDESLLHKISAEMAQYWEHVDRLHKEHHIVSDLAIEIDAAASFSQISDRAAGFIADLRCIHEYLIESDQMRQSQAASDGAPSGPNDFEMLYIGFTNTLTKLSVALTQMDIKYLEEFLKLNPADGDARQRLEQRKHEFARLATAAGYAD